MLQIILFALIALSLILFMKSYHPEYAMIASAAAGMIMLAAIAVKIVQPIRELFGLLEDYGVDRQLTIYLLKALGICYLTRFSAGLCADFGQTNLSGKVELAGRAAIFLLSLPLIRNILNVGLSLM